MQTGSLAQCSKRIFEGQRDLAIRRHESALIRRFGRTEQRLSAEVNRLQATIATHQKDKLDLSLRLEERTKELASTSTRLSEVKARCKKLAVEVESSERAIWRMASQLEVGTHSVLSQWSQTGVVAGLQKRLEAMQQKVKDADAQVETYRKKASDAEKEHQMLRQKVQGAQEEAVKMEEKWQRRMEELQDEMEAGRRAIESVQEEHEATRLQLEEERKRGEENVHKVSEYELKIVELQRVVEDLKQVVEGGRLALAEANEAGEEKVKRLQEELSDVKNRLDEAVAKNEIREDAFSRNWTASQWRTAMSAGEYGEGSGVR